MNSDWNPCKLKDIINIKHGYAFKGAFFTDVPNNNLVLTPGNFKIGGGFKYSKGKYYTEEYPEEYKLKPGDVIVTMTDLSKAGDTLGYSAKIPHSEYNLLHNQRLGLVENLAPEEVDLDFIHWLLRRPDYQSFIVSGASGSTVRHTSPSRILEFEFELPPLADQRIIAHTLTSLENKIETNESINSTIESIAQTLFKSWFVDFDPVRAKVATKVNGKDPQLAAMQTISGKTAEELENLTAENRQKLAATADLFPDELIETEHGEIPKGWEWKKLGDITTFLSRGLTPKYADEGVMVINQRCIRNHTIDFDQARYHDEKLRSLGTKEVKVGDVLINSTGVGTLGRVAIVKRLMQKTTIDTHVTIVRADENKVHADYLGYYVLENESLIEEMGEGSTGQTELKRSVLEEMTVCTPTMDVQMQFSAFVHPMMTSVSNNELESLRLQAIRDSLLPKLLSGDLEPAL